MVNIVIGLCGPSLPPISRKKFCLKQNPCSPTKNLLIEYRFHPRADSEPCGHPAKRMIEEKNAFVNLCSRRSGQLTPNPTVDNRSRCPSIRTEKMQSIASDAHHYDDRLPGGVIDSPRRLSTVHRNEQTMMTTTAVMTQQHQQ